MAGLKQVSLLSFGKGKGNDEILDKAGISELKPHQEEMIRELRKHKENNRGTVISAPTSSGKTIPVILHISDYIREGDRVIYAVPLKALVNEKFNEIKKLLGDFAVVGKVGEEDAWKKDIVVGTYEQLYSHLLRSSDDFKNFSLIILDDFHVLYDKKRGFTVEKLATLARMNNIRIVAMSATIEPLDEIAEWIRGEPLKYGKEARTVPLSYEVLELEKGEDVVDKIRENMKPCIIFCSKKQEAESRAQKLTEKLKSTSLSLFEKQIGKKEKRRLNVQEILEEFDRKGVNITEYEEELSECITKGVAWHHSDVDERVKDLIEKWYNEGYIDFLFATTTLAYGFNSPTRTVIIADITRWDRDTRKSDFIPVYEWLQMAGRAGRLGFSEGGVVYTCVRSEEQRNVVKSKYHAERVEECESSMSEDDFFRKAILELIDAGMNTDEKIKKFFLNTYYYARGKSKIKWIPPDIEEEIKEHVKALHKLGFINPTHAGYKLTDFGKITAGFLQKTHRWYELSEFSMLREDIKSRDEIKSSSEAIVITLRHLKPLRLEPSEGKGKNKIDDYFKQKFNRLPEYYEYTAYIVLGEWIKGRRIENIEKDYGRWAIYVKSIAEDLWKALKFFFKDVAELEKVKLPKDFDLMVDRVKYGLSSYEVPLTEVRGFGRERIHQLYLRIKEVAEMNKRLEERLKVDRTIIDTLVWYFKERGEKQFKEDLKKWKIKYVGEKMIDRLVEFLKNKLKS